MRFDRLDFVDTYMSVFIKRSATISMGCTVAGNCWLSSRLKPVPEREWVPCHGLKLRWCQRLNHGAIWGVFDSLSSILSLILRRGEMRWRLVLLFDINSQCHGTTIRTKVCWAVEAVATVTDIMSHALSCQPAWLQSPDCINLNGREASCCRLTDIYSE